MQTLYHEDFDAPSPLWGSWHPHRYRAGCLEVDSLKPWRLYRRVMIAVDPTRKFKSTTTRVARWCGFRDRIDYNQCSGIGWLLLYAFLRHPPVTDLLGRTISLRLRGENWRPHGSQAYFWVQGHAERGVSTANYALTGQPLNAALCSGQWEELSLPLTPDSGWQYAGNNVHQPHAARYAYAPIEHTLRHIANLHLLVVMPEPVNCFPQGRLQLAHFAII